MPEITPTRNGLLLLLALSLMASLMNSSAPTPLYGLYKEHLNLSALDLTLIFGAYGIGVLSALMTMARVAGSAHDLRVLLVPATFLAALGAWLFSQGSSLGQLCGARLIAGLGAGALTACVNVALKQFGPDDNGKLAALLATLAMVLGLALGPLISGAAVQLGLQPLRSPFWLIMALIILATAGALVLWPHPSTLPVRPKASGHEKTVSLRRALDGIGAPFHLCAWSVFFSWAFAACVFVIGPSAAEQQLGLTDRGVFGYVISAYLLTAGASQVFSQRKDARRTLLSGLLAQNLGILLLMAAFYRHSLLLAFVGLAIGGYAYGAIFVGSARLINQLAPAHSHAKIVSYFYMTVYMFTVVPVPLGIAVDALGLARAVTASLWVFLIIGLCLVFLATRIALSGALISNTHVNSQDHE